MNLAALQNQLVFRVAEAYYRVLQARELVEVRGEAVAQVEQHLEIVASRFRNETAVQSDVLTVEVQLFFTATAMIGMIALSGTATRNGILLIEFVHAELRRCDDLRVALIKSGGVRFRPIFLTAGAAMLGAWPITLDPVFSGLAWALIFGLLVSTAFTLVLVPVVYWLIYAHRPRHGLPDDEQMAEELA